MTVRDHGDSSWHSFNKRPSVARDLRRPKAKACGEGRLESREHGHGFHLGSLVPNTIDMMEPSIRHGKSSARRCDAVQTTTGNVQQRPHVTASRRLTRVAPDPTNGPAGKKQHRTF